MVKNPSCTSFLTQCTGFIPPPPPHRRILEDYIAVLGVSVGMVYQNLEVLKYLRALHTIVMYFLDGSSYLFQIV